MSGRKEYQPGDKSCIGYGERIEEKIFVAIECRAFPQSVVLNVFPISKKYVGGNFFPLQCNCVICILGICLRVTKSVSVVCMIYFFLNMQQSWIAGGEDDLLILQDLGFFEIEENYVLFQEL